MENHHFQWENPLSMVIFNSYLTNYQRVSLFIFHMSPIIPTAASLESASPCPGTREEPLARSGQLRATDLKHGFDKDKIRIARLLMLLNHTKPMKLFSFVDMEIQPFSALRRKQHVSGCTNYNGDYH